MVFRNLGQTDVTGTGQAPQVFSVWLSVIIDAQNVRSPASKQNSIMASRIAVTSPICSWPYCRCVQMRSDRRAVRTQGTRDTLTRKR